MMFGRVAKIPISKTPNEPAEMDFSDYGCLETALLLQDTFPGYPIIVFVGTKKRGGTDR